MSTHKTVQHRATVLYWIVRIVWWCHGCNIMSILSILVISLICFFVAGRSSFITELGVWHVLIPQTHLRGDANYFGGQQYNAFAGGCTLELLSDGLSSNKGMWHGELLVRCFQAICPNCRTFSVWALGCCILKWGSPWLPPSKEGI